jgi:hypothetical protein
MTYPKHLGKVVWLTKGIGGPPLSMDFMSIL